MDSLNTVIASLFLWISSHLHVINVDFKQPSHYPEVKFKINYLKWHVKDHAQ